MITSGARLCRFVLVALLMVVLGDFAWAAPQVTFDLPDTIECRDVTPREFAAAHPTLKVIEARLRISARINDGAEPQIVDFMYMIASPEKRMKFQDYLPNTTLESTAAGDEIEVAATNENATGTLLDAHVSYKVLALGGTRTQSNKKSESNKYRQIAPKALVLASGTTDREHGVFFKLRPSKAASLEGAKEFTFLAVVPRTWRGDWCTVSCAARIKGRSFFTKTVVSAGVEQAQIGVYLAGDVQAAALAEELRRVQENYAAVLAGRLANNEDRLLETMYSAVSTQASEYAATLCGIFTGRKGDTPGEPKKPDPERQKLEEAERALLDVQERLKRLAQ